MSRKPVIAGNWKMHKLQEESKNLVNDIMIELKDIPNDKLPEVVVAPVFTSVPIVSKAINDCGCGKVKLSAQNCYYEKQGAYTGEVSVEMLKDAGCEYIIIGHSERRQYFSETDEMINKKAKAILNNGLIPIICCGESLEQREAGITDSHIESQIKLAFEGLSESEVKTSIIAYEPIWAIGTGKTCDSNEANRVIAMIRSVISKISSQDSANTIRILYGGSVKPETIQEQMSMSDIDGALVGGASLTAESFGAIVKGAINYSIA